MRHHETADLSALQQAENMTGISFKQSVEISIQGKCQSRVDVGQGQMVVIY